MYESPALMPGFFVDAKADTGDWC